MRLDEKRKVIEVLLCVHGNFPATPAVAAIELGHRSDSNVALRADNLRWKTRHEDNSSSYDDTCREAAYRLIESSPTLIKEWFRS